MKKKEWLRPMLSVLIRVKPQERLLESCKSGSDTAGSTANYESCQVIESCDNCQSNPSSGS